MFSQGMNRHAALTQSGILDNYTILVSAVVLARIHVWFARFGAENDAVVVDRTGVFSYENGSASCSFHTGSRSPFRTYRILVATTDTVTLLCDPIGRSRKAANRQCACNIYPCMTVAIRIFDLIPTWVCAFCVPIGTNYPRCHWQCQL